MTKKLSTKLIVLLLAAALLIGCGVGGTLAWLVTQTETVVNTFTIGNIEIELEETDEDKNFKMVPGSDIVKDPKVTVKANSEACWLFVEIAEADGDENLITTDDADSTTYITYGVRDGWTPLADHSGVYYREVDTSTAEQPFYVLSAGDADKGLANGYVHVEDSVTKGMMDDAEDVAKLKLSITAYAVQKENITDAAAAWAQAKTPSNYPTPPAENPTDPAE